MSAFRIETLLVLGARFDELEDMGRHGSVIIAKVTRPSFPEECLPCASEYLIPAGDFPESRG